MQEIVCFDEGEDEFEDMDSDGDGKKNSTDQWPTCKGNGSIDTQCSLADQQRLTIEWCK